MVVSKVVYIASEHCGLCKQIRPLIERICTENGVDFERIDASAIPAEFHKPILNSKVRDLPIIIVLSDSDITVMGRSDSSKIDIRELERMIKDGKEETGEKDG